MPSGVSDNPFQFCYFDCFSKYVCPVNFVINKSCSSFRSRTPSLQTMFDFAECALFYFLFFALFIPYLLLMSSHFDLLLKPAHILPLKEDLKMQMAQQLFFVSPCYLK